MQGRLEYLWPDNKSGGMPFSKPVNAAHHSQAISTHFSPPVGLKCFFVLCVLRFFYFSLSFYPQATAAWS